MNKASGIAAGAALVALCVWMGAEGLVMVNKAACGVFLAPFAVLLFYAVDQGRSFMVPLAVMLIYLVLSARAAVLSGADAPPDAASAGPARVRAGRTTGAVRG